jgi:hypothetical protein
MAAYFSVQSTPMRVKNLTRRRKAADARSGRGPDRTPGQKHALHGPCGILSCPCTSGTEFRSTTRPRIDLYPHGCSLRHEDDRDARHKFQVVEDQDVLSGR